jgi:hypothetical protein
MQLWTSLRRVTRRPLRIGENTLELEQLMVERLIVAYDLAAAFGTCMITSEYQTLLYIIYCFSR